MRIAFLSALVGGATIASAQVPSLNINGRAGYFFGDEVSGPELGVDLPFTSFPGLTVMFSPSITFGDDGTITRFMLTGRTPITVEGFYGRFGLGYANVTGDLDDNGFGSQFTLGYELRSFIPLVSTSLELTYYQHGSDALRGFTIGLAARFAS